MTRAEYLDIYRQIEELRAEAEKLEPRHFKSREYIEEKILELEDHLLRNPIS